ncbi:MAG: hypothetical protein CME71_04860 [Halobacteriovorax sp.]|nr:hypothetical protein [Halobacteriovorax sp.]
MRTDSAHLILDLWMEGQWSNDWVAKLEDIIDQEFTVVHKSRHLFEPQGETVAFILSESHFTLHSYPEENYVSFDVYICKPDFDFVQIVKKIEAFLPIARIHQRSFRRGEYALPWLSRWKNSEKGLFLATFILASCSLLYELMLAQTLSSILGDTAHRYNVTIGMYIASMGLGALLYEKFQAKRLTTSLLKVETLLIIVGGLAPFLSLILDSSLREYPILLSILLHSLIVAIGVLSGFELPLLMDMGQKKKEGLSTVVLGVDYLGTLFGAIIVPLFLVPLVSLFGISAVVAFFNCVVALYFSIELTISKKANFVWVMLFVLLACLSWLGWANHLEIQEWIVGKYFLGDL